MASTSNLNNTDIEQHAFISVRLVTMDHYMAEPITSDLDPVYSSFRSSPVRKVPVLRIFGPTINGQKTCLHIHGILPYMFVPKPEEADDSFPYKLAASLDKALNISMLAGLNNEESDSKRTKNPQEHVFKIIEVRARPFYGYHPREHSFYKIFFYNPWLVKRAADILQNGAVMGRVLQPHFSHIPYTLQFMMDYNLQGMNMIHLRHCLFRRNKNILGSTPTENKTYLSSSFLQNRVNSNELDNSISQCYFDIRQPPANQFLLPDTIQRMSISELEIDAVAVDILNTNEDLMSQTLCLPEGMSLSLTPPMMKSKRATLAGKKKKLTNPGLEALWQDERMRRATLLAGTLDEDAESLSPPDSPPRNRTSDWKSDSQQFWEERYSLMVEDMKNKGMLDEKEDPNDKDPDSTANFLKKVNKSGPLYTNEKNVDQIVYPVEISDDESQSLQEATALDSHVCSLSQSILCTPQLSKSTSMQKKEVKRNKLSLRKKKLSLDESIIDEDILSQTISESFSQTEEDKNIHYFDEDEAELMDLLSELGKERTMAAQIKSKDPESTSRHEQNDPTTSEMFATPSQVLTKRQFEEDLKDTLEMSQVWDSDPVFEGRLENKGTAEKYNDMQLPLSPVSQTSSSNVEHLEDNIDDYDIFSSSQPGGISEGLSDRQIIAGDDDDFFVSSQPNSPALNAPSTSKQARVTYKQKKKTSNISTKDEEGKDWEDDSFWNAIDFENL